MVKKWTLAQAFAHFGAAGANPRWSWSARSADGKTVVMTLWRDEFDFSSRPTSYSSFGNRTEDWMARPGNRERLDNLVWAREHCDGLFRVVIAVAVDPAQQPREIASCFPRDDWMMKVVDLDESTGEFRVVLI